MQPSSARIGLGRSNAVVTVCLLAFLAFVVVAGVRGGIVAADPSARVLGYGLAGLFALPLLMLLRALPRFLAPRFVLVDPSGLGIQHGRETVRVPWSDIAAVGIGYALAEPERRAPARTVPTSADDVKELVADRLAAAAAEALHVSSRRQLALEIFPSGPDALQRYGRLRPYVRPLTPPVAGLPSTRWRFPLPPVVAIAEQLGAALRAGAPQRWAGWMSRPWQGK